MPAQSPQLVGQLVRSDGEEKGLQLALVIKVGHTVEKADEGFLHNVLAGGVIVQSPIDERQQSAFIACDQVFPGVGIALADLLNQETVAFGRHQKTNNNGDWQKKGSGSFSPSCPYKYLLLAGENVPDPFFVRCDHVISAKLPQMTVPTKPTAASRNNQV